MRFTKLAVPALASAAVICGVSLTAAWANERPEAYPEEVRPVVEMDHDAVNAERRIETNALCKKQKTGPFCGSFSDDKKNVVVLGDSIAPEGYLLVNEVAPEVNILTAERAGCPPLRDLTGITYSFAGCEQLNDKRLRAIERNADRIDTVMLAMRLDDERVSESVELVRSFEDMGIRVVVWGVGAHYDQSAWQTIAGHGSLDTAGDALHDHLDVAPALNDTYAEQIAETGATYIDRWEWMCGTTSCRTYLGDDVTKLVVIDGAHMTRAGTLAFARDENNGTTLRAALGVLD